MFLKKELELSNGMIVPLWKISTITLNYDQRSGVIELAGCLGVDKSPVFQAKMVFDNRNGDFDEYFSEGNDTRSSSYAFLMAKSTYENGSVMLMNLSEKIDLSGAEITTGIEEEI